MRGPRINLSVPKLVYDDIKNRKNFNASEFFHQKYREEFLDEAGIKEKIKELKSKLTFYEDRLMGLQDEKIVTPSYNINRCPICSMFFHEDVSIRNKIHIYKSLYACRQCTAEQPQAIEKIKLEMQAREEAQDV